MSVVNITNVVVLNNPAGFQQPLQFKITFQSGQDLEEDLEWKLVYVGSAEDTNCDQVLEEVMVGPVHVGLMEFVLQAEAPNPSTIPVNDLVGVTVVLITASYKEKEFLRVGYYVNNEHRDSNVNEAIAEGRDPGVAIVAHDITRNILADRPRVTRFPIDWGNGDPVAPPPADAEGAAAADLLAEGEEDAMLGEGNEGDGAAMDEQEEAEDDNGDDAAEVDISEELGNESDSSGGEGAAASGEGNGASGGGVSAMDESFETAAGGQAPSITVNG